MRVGALGNGAFLSPGGAYMCSWVARCQATWASAHRPRAQGLGTCPMRVWPWQLGQWWAQVAPGHSPHRVVIDSSLRSSHKDSSGSTRPHQ